MGENGPSGKNLLPTDARDDRSVVPFRVIPTMARILQNITSLFRRQKEPAKSQEQLKAEMEAFRLQLSALECIGQGEDEQAIALFTEAFACESLGPERLYNFRGDCYQRLDRHPLAIKDYTQHLQSHQEDRDVYRARSISYGELDQFPLQMKDLQQVKTLLGREKKLSEDERQLLAEVVFDLERDKIHAEYHDELGRLRAEMEDALDQARKAHPQYSRHNPLYNIPKKVYHPASEKAVKKGMEFDNMGQFTLALEYYDYAVDVNPADPAALNLRAFCLQSLEYYLDAIEDFTAALVWAPDDPNLHFGLGNCLAALKKYDLAVLHGDRAVQWAAAKDPRYAAYEELALERGYKDAAQFYEMMVAGWMMADHGPGDPLSGISSSHADIQEYIRNQQKQEDKRMDHLLRRRDR
jgi:tetratricopeptide (TPR) repeat protein